MAATSMKRKTFLRLTLLIPYLALGASFAVSAPIGNIFDFSYTDNFLVNVLIFFTVSAIIWGPLYTWIVVVLLLWSIGRSEHEIYQAYLLSPLILAGSMGIPASLIDLPQAGMVMLWGFLYSARMEFFMRYLFPYFTGEYAAYFAALIFMMGTLCLVVGYAIVLPVTWLDRALRKRNVLIVEN
jgi:hypothetical protein